MYRLQLGPEMQPMQKYILLVGIVLDFYAKTVLFRELSRFATQDAWTWFSMVFIFFLLSGCCTTAYWWGLYKLNPDDP